MAAVCKTKEHSRQTSSETRKIKRLEKEIEALNERYAKKEAELKASRSKYRIKNKELCESKAECEKLQRCLKNAEDDLEKSKNSNEEHLRINKELQRKLDRPKGSPLPRSSQGEFEGKMTNGFIRKVRG